MFYASVDAVGQVEAYVRSERAWAISHTRSRAVMTGRPGSACVFD
jgi:hypothetical protein